jgi:hypothetical protein
VKRESLLRFLRLHGCYLKREGAAHSLWCNPKTGQTEAVPRHSEIADLLARKNMPWIVDSRDWTGIVGMEVVAFYKAGRNRVFRSLFSPCRQEIIAA